MVEGQPGVDQHFSFELEGASADVGTAGGFVGESSRGPGAGSPPRALEGYFGFWT